MDNINLRKKVFAAHDFSTGTMLASVAFAIGAVSAVLLKDCVIRDVVSVVENPATYWLCLVMLLFAQAVCVIMPGARLLAMLLSALCGAVTLLASYMYCAIESFSAEFFELCAVMFTFAAALAYTSSGVFELAHKLRAFIRADCKLRRELNIFCMVFAMLSLAVVISIAFYIF